MFYSEHPQRRLHILLSILAFVVVVGSMTLYQINRADRPEQVALPEKFQGTNKLTAQERANVVVRLKEEVSKSPPLTDSQRGQIIESLRQAVAQ